MKNARVFRRLELFEHVERLERVLEVSNKRAALRSDCLISW